MIKTKKHKKVFQKQKLKFEEYKNCSETTQFKNKNKLCRKK